MCNYNFILILLYKYDNIIRNSICTFLIIFKTSYIIRTSTIIGIFELV